MHVFRTLAIGIAIAKSTEKLLLLLLILLRHYPELLLLRLLTIFTIAHVWYRAFIQALNDHKRVNPKHLVQPLLRYRSQVPKVSPKGTYFELQIFFILPSIDVYLCDFVIYQLKIKVYLVLRALFHRYCYLTKEEPRITK